MYSQSLLRIDHHVEFKTRIAHCPTNYEFQNGNIQIVKNAKVRGYNDACLEFGVWYHHIHNNFTKMVTPCGVKFELIDPLNKLSTSAKLTHIYYNNLPKMII